MTREGIGDREEAGLHKIIFFRYLIFKFFKSSVKVRKFFPPDFATKRAKSFFFQGGLKSAGRTSLVGFAGAGCLLFKAL